MGLSASRLDRGASLVKFDSSGGECLSSVGKSVWGTVTADPLPLLDVLDHLCHQVEGDPTVEEEFYGATTPAEMVALAEHCGILIDADDFLALLRSGSTEYWEVRGEDGSNPIVHLLRVFGV